MRHTGHFMGHRLNSYRTFQCSINYLKTFQVSETLEILKRLVNHKITTPP